jgi:hypothetical protein
MKWSGSRKHTSALDLNQFEEHYVPMTYVTIEGEIADGRVVPKEGGQLPERGRALVTLLPEAPHRTNWDVVEASLGVLRRSNLDSLVWQREVRAEWDRD